MRSRRTSFPLIHMSGRMAQWLRRLTTTLSEIKRFQVRLLVWSIFLFFFRQSINFVTWRMVVVMLAYQGVGMSRMSFSTLSIKEVDSTQIWGCKLGYQRNLASSTVHERKRATFSCPLTASLVVRSLGNQPIEKHNK